MIQYKRNEVIIIGSIIVSLIIGLLTIIIMAFQCWIDHQQNEINRRQNKITSKQLKAEIKSNEIASKSSKAAVALDAVNHFDHNIEPHIKLILSKLAKYLRLKGIKVTSKDYSKYSKYLVYMVCSKISITNGVSNIRYLSQTMFEISNWCAEYVNSGIANNHIVMLSVKPELQEFSKYSVIMILYFNKVNSIKMSNYIRTIRNYKLAQL